MSREVQVLVRCDDCRLPADGDRFVSEGIPLVVNKTEREIDLCSDCQDKLDQALAYWVERSRKPHAEVSANGSKKRSKASTRPGAKKFICPECEEPFETPQGRGTHRRSKHGVIGVKRRDRSELVCPECSKDGKEFVAKSVQGLGKHRNAAHGVIGTRGRRAA